ncbi:hypothetical protein FHW72_002483 [Ochrobactrum sp. RC6B]|nr:hypothetical protein [Ochrobactrum sp. RC6B]
MAEQTEIARVRQPHEAAGKIRAINRGIEEESQRRYYTVHRRHRGVLALLPYLEAAQIIHGRGIGRPREKGGRSSDVAQIVALSLVPEVAQVHVVDQALTKRADRGRIRLVVHGQAPC